MRVFVSATSADLKSFREAVSDQLQRLGVEPVEQTYFEVTDQTLPMMLKKKVQACDAVICLVGLVFGAAPPNSRRSYTQMEYDLAQELGKRTFLFFPSPQCKLDHTESKAGESAESITAENQDTPEQREWQKKYADDFLPTLKLRYKFDNHDHLRWLTAEAVFELSPEAAGGPIARSVRTDFPTPLALLYDDCIPDGDSALLRTFVTELLRFISWLAIHDSAVHRILGCQNADKKQSRSLMLPESPSDWRSLLSLACPPDDQPFGARFITELAGWDARNAEALDAIVEYDRALSKRRRTDSEELGRKVRAAMNTIVGDLEFLKRYVLIAVTKVNSETGKCAATVMHGLAARSIELATDPQSPAYAQENQLYLLNVDNRRALWLSPAFKYKRVAGQDRVYLWDGLDPDRNQGNDTGSECVTTLMTSSDDTISIPERRDTLSAWLGEDLCEEALGFRVPARPIAWQDKLLDDESWNKLQEVVLPPGEPLVLGERFRRASAPLHRGLHADVYEATDIGCGPSDEHTEDEAVAVPAQPVVHVLLAQGAADEQVREWFKNRSDCWRRTEHPSVLRLYDAGDPAGKKGRPFLLTDLVPGSGSLEDLIPPAESVAEKTLRQAITLAAEVCRAAHQQGIFLFALPPRHFLMDGKENLHLTGFETAIPGTTGEEFPPSLLKRLSQFSRDVDIIAPEARRDSGTFAPTLDVFAIGSLLAQLRRLPTGAMDVLSVHNWGDPWHCLTYHCLAADPNLRFQSAEQILTFLAELRPGDEPRTVTVAPTAAEPGFAIGKYPVTNAEYKQFCSERECSPPLYLSDRVREDEEQQAEMARRLSGPWLPVTYVSLLDAQRYCEWLSKRTHKKWRLPKETEWLRAARSQSGGEYPWGSEAPDSTVSNYGRRYRGPTVVGTFSKGRSGADCWDMAGNVWEWCTDIVENGAPRRVVKGGAYDYSADSLQLTSGDARVVTCRSPHVGFRVLCEENR